MSYVPTYDKGSWKAICDICGELHKSSELKLQWDGLMVCKADWSPRHPQDFLRGVKDDQSVAWTRTEAADVETDTSGWVTPTPVPDGTFDNSL